MTCEDDAPKEVFQRSPSLSVAAAPSGPAPVDPKETRERPAGSTDQEGAQRIAHAWAAGVRAGGGTPLPRRQASIHAQALELLTAGGQDQVFLMARAQWMGQGSRRGSGSRTP